MILYETTINGIPTKLVTSTDDITNPNALYFKNFDTAVYCEDVDCNGCPFQDTSCMTTTFSDVHDLFYTLRETHPELFI